MKLTKANLIDQIYATHPRISKTQARQAIESFIHIIQSSLESGDDVLLSGFGKFNVKAKRARKARNPQTGESLMLEARKVVTFKASGKLKKVVNDE